MDLILDHIDLKVHLFSCFSGFDLTHMRLVSRSCRMIADQNEVISNVKNRETEYYTHWAKYITANQLRVLLWNVGVFGDKGFAACVVAVPPEYRMWGEIPFKEPPQFHYRQIPEIQAIWAHGSGKKFDETSFDTSHFRHFRGDDDDVQSSREEEEDKKPTRLEDIVTEKFKKGLQPGKYCRWGNKLSIEQYKKIFYAVGVFADAGPFDPEDVSTWNMTHMVSLYGLERITFSGSRVRDMWEFIRRRDYGGLKFWPELNDIRS
eukprot:TRINITY_DN2067_c0_g1_i2.p1 TRINITY_DN2067_c0_g1~~TRINITY_DN2067_c0_g1_i2.p1  ORF type:complete len:262 (+),score=36.73 TRINITY_DN2067_c0_g1_i2:46-831(+)